MGAQLLVMGSAGPDDGQRTDEELRELRDDLIGGLDSALYVAGFSGLHSGVNPVSGDFSVGADGLMIRDGELAEPVRELTVASTIQRMLHDIVAVGTDFEWLPSGDGAVSLVIDDISISGTA